MQSQNLKLVLVAIAIAAGLSACKAKVDAKSEAPPADVFANQVAGPALDGDWQGHCVEDGWGAGYVIFNYSFQGRSLMRTETKYTDVQCTVQESQLTRSGIFRYVNVFVRKDKRWYPISSQSTPMKGH